MNERQLQRLLQRLLAFSAPLPLALLGSACGGSSSMDAGGAAGNGATAGMGTAGVGGAVSAGAGGASAGSAGIGNGGASAGSGGASAGAGGTSAGAGGTSAGAGGVGGGCKPLTQTFCGSGSINVVPKTCVDASMASVGTTLPMATCTDICNAMFGASCNVNAVDSTSVTVHCIAYCPAGRRPAGLPPSVAFRDIGAYFAELTRLEAASVPAFRILRDELRAHGAPQKLLRAAARAARDEVRHARAARALARHYGGAARVAAVPRRKPRSLEAIAIENAVEGCVRETYAALLANHQAKHATEPNVRAAMMRIARDETRHAALSWDVSRWLEQRLPPSAKRSVQQAREAAVRELLSSVAAEQETPFADVVGLPGPAAALALASGMKQALWA
ncbi:MAG: hypothetical protein ABJB12_11735 [Pseudomonadota bacterium]